MSTLARRRWTSSKLPLELCESIVRLMYPRPDWDRDIDIFDRGRTRDLCSCLLVCRDWVPISRIELYRYVRLDNKRRAIGFMKIVIAFSSLGKYVQGLHLSGRSDDKCSDWLYTVHQAVSSRLPNLSLLEYCRLPVVHPIFFILPSRFHSVRRLRLSNLESWSLRETVRLLNRFAQLEELVITSCKWGKNIPASVYSRRTNRENAPNPFAPRFELVARDLDDRKGCIVMVGWLARSRLSYSLCSISLNVDLTTSEGLRDLLYQCSGTLESIQLKISSLTDDSDMTCTRCSDTSFDRSHDSIQGCLQFRVAEDSKCLDSILRTGNPDKETRVIYGILFLI